MSSLDALPSNLRAPPRATSSVRISTGEFPERDRLAIMREVLGRSLFRAEFEPLPGQPIWSEWVLFSLPGLKFCRCYQSPLRTTRTAPLLENGGDNVIFCVATAPRQVNQLGREIEYAAGEGGAYANPNKSIVTFASPNKQIALVVPRKSLGPLLHERGHHFLQQVHAGSAALRLLTGYLSVLNESFIESLDMQRLVVSHVHELLALALGASRDGLEIAKARGVRAARLRAIKKDVMANLDRHFSINAIASRHRLTPRYVQKLFEDEGTTFTEFVRNKQLECAHAWLADHQYDDRRVIDIALDAGFGDLSYFNRLFKRRFGMTPGEVRERDNSDEGRNLSRNGVRLTGKDSNQ